MIRRGPARRLAIALLLGGALLVSPPAVSGGGVPWDLGIALGYVCAVLCVCLYLFPVRSDGLPHARLLGLARHEMVGWCLLATGTLHAVVLILVQPQLGRYLLPSSPVYMWCGIAALVLAGFLVRSGLAVRSALKRASARSGASTHILAAALMILTLCAHLIGSGQLIGGIIKTVSALLLLILPLGWFALRRRKSRPLPSRLRTGHLVTAATALLLPAPIVKHYLREPPSRPDVIAVSFPHDKHTSVTCVECHHNFVDHTGMTACIECHRSGRPELAASSESTFHTFCRDCHARLAVEAAAHGPTRGCSDCHHATTVTRDVE